MIAAPTQPSASGIPEQMSSVSLGQKRTDIGVIPMDWDVRPLRDCLRRPPDYGINASAVPYDDQCPTYIRITDITEDGRFAPSAKVSVRHPKASSFYLVAGDLVFARTGATVGKSYLYDPTDGPLVFAGYLIRVAPDPRVLNSAFLSYYAQSERYWDWVRVMSTRSGQPGINGQEYGSLMLPLPDSSEQRAIAAALSDIDSLIAALDALIAKKRAIKQATMQQLLTGRTRLLGFEGEWEEKTIGDFTDCTSGGTPNTEAADYWHGSISWMNSGDLHLKRIYEVAGRISEAGLANSSTKLVPANCVLVGLAGQGKTRGTVAMNMVSLCTNQSIAAIFPNSSFDSTYLYYNLENRYEELRDLSTGDGGRGGLNLAIIRAISVPFPTKQEQRAIAEVLSDMDAEIEALEARVAKTRDIKQGMMQQLLTGRIRLPVPAPEEATP